MTKENKETFPQKILDILSSFRVWVLIFFIFLSIIAVNYTFDNDGVVINGITPGSAAEAAGISFDSKSSLRGLEKINYVNNEKIYDVAHFYSIISGLEKNTTVKIITDQNSQGYEIYIPAENTSVSELIGISVREAPTSNVKLGIELEGGSRLILSPVQNLSDEQFDLLVNTLQSRLDVYGASGTKVNKLEDAFSNEKYVIVESTSSNKNDIYELIKRQGEFVAKLGNETAFTGENIFMVLNDPQHTGLEQCSQTAEGGYVCTYRFTVEIDAEGAQQFYDIAKDLDVVNGQLSEKIHFILDDKEITALSVASSFKYQKVTTPVITVSGNEARTEAAAIDSAKKEMEFLQAILSTKSLPSELTVVQSYSISSSLGEKLLENAIWVGLAALLLVSSIVALRYRHFGIFVGIFIALISEVIIVFGIAAFMRLSIDLAAIGGLIAAIGTGVDDQIIITDEYFRGRKKKISSRKKIKTAFYIIMIAYFTTLAAMIPLYFAGLKVLQGFAFMIIIGVTIGVFVTRPAYTQILNRIMTSKEQRKKEEAEEF